VIVRQTRNKGAEEAGRQVVIASDNSVDGVDPQLCKLKSVKTEQQSIKLPGSYSTVVAQPQAQCQAQEYLSACGDTLLFQN
jgi:hypothetical protein